MKMFIAAALVVTSAPVIASVASEDGATEQRPERRICRRVRGPSSSTRIERRVCMTRAQWNAQQDASVDDEMTEVETRVSPTPAYENGVIPKGSHPN